jgi:hypothetical protein
VKIRNGFVSNSSTTSFSIYGIYVENDIFSPVDILFTLSKSKQKLYNEVIEYLQNSITNYLGDCPEPNKNEGSIKIVSRYTAMIESFKNNDKKSFKNHLKQLSNEDCDFDMESFDYELYDIVERCGLETISIFRGDGYIYIGRSFSSIRDEETGKQFKESTVTLIRDILGKKVKCSVIEETIAS